MILTAHQPVYLPWPGLFHKIAICDKFCFFDVVQYQKKDYNNRNRIKTKTGELLLSVPVNSKGYRQRKISDMEIQPGPWTRKHIRSIRNAYSSTPYFDVYFPAIEFVINKDHSRLVDLNLDLLLLLMKNLGLDNIDVVKASSLDLAGKKSDLVLDMCLKLEAEQYIFGSQGVNYADLDSFKENGVMPYFQNYNHPVYDQINGPFIGDLSVIDLLFNQGEKSLDILMSGNISKEELLNYQLH